MVKLGVLRHRAYRRVFTGQVLSSLGTALVPVALAFAILHQLGSTTDLGLALASQEGASLVCYLLGGVVSDRFSRKWAMVCADTVRALSQGALGLLLVAGTAPLGAVCGLCAAGGLAAGVFVPASQGLTPQLLDEDELHEANSLQSASLSLTLLIGPAIAGVLTATVGGGWAILADGATFALNALALATLRQTLPVGDREASPIGQLREGWHAFRERRWYVQIIGSTAVANLCAGVFITLGPASAVHFGGAPAWAAILAVGAIGSTVGMLGMSRVEPRYPLRFGTALMLGWAALPIVVAVHPPLVAMCAVSAVGFFGLTVCNALLLTSVQRTVPAQLLSRVLSYDAFLSFVSLPIGLSVAGPLAGAVGVTPALAGAGALMLTVELLTLLAPAVRNFSPGLTEAERAEHGGAEGADADGVDPHRPRQDGELAGPASRA